VADLVVSWSALGVFVLLAAAYASRSLLLGRVRHQRADADGGSAFLNKPTMEMVYRLLEPLVGTLARLRVTPSIVTLSSLMPAAVAGVAIGFGWFGLGGLAATLAAFCDILNGLLARKTKLTSHAGEVIDAAVDRYSELFPFAGLAYFYRSHDDVLFIVLAGLLASIMISYATVKAEAMGVAAPRGAMRRGERAAYLIGGCLLTPTAHALFGGVASLAVRELPIILAMTIVAVVGNISVVQRFAAVIAAIRERDVAARPIAPEEGVVAEASRTLP
jgi:CDP-diacylglycerol--glycerol-3-phosphate 3-phosphatidyltransferase